MSNRQTQIHAGKVQPHWESLDHPMTTPATHGLLD